MPLLSVIVLARDRAADTRRCLSALRRHTPGPLEVILYDNASGPDAAAAFRRLADGWAQLRLVRNRRNVPFAEAVNAGMRAAKGEHLCWLNNDAVVGPGWRRGLEAALASRPAAAAAGPLTGNMAPPEQVAAGPGRGIRPVPFLGGFCLMLRRGAWEEAGPLDERFVWGWEDMDYCLRLRAAGRSLLLARGVYVEHAGSATLRAVPNPERRRTDLANRGLFRRLWGERPEVAALMARTPAPWEEPRPEVSVIVPLAASDAVTRACLAALQRARGRHRLETVLVGPSAQARRLADATLLPVSLVAAPRAAGLPRAFNLGLAGCRADTVLLLDPRARPDPGFLTALRAALRAAPAGSAAGPLSELTHLPWQSGVSRAAVGYLRGGCLLLGRRTLERAGGLDEGLLWPDAEADLCLRLGRRGGAVELVRGTRVRGRLRAVYRPDSPAKRASCRRMFERWGPLEAGRAR